MFHLLNPLRLPALAVATPSQRPFGSVMEAAYCAAGPAQLAVAVRERVEDLVGRKRRGEEIVTEGAPPEGSNVVDLMDALRRSAEQARGRRPAGASAEGKTASRAKGRPKRKAG